jgi:hypothetical protein
MNRRPNSGFATRQEKLMTNGTTKDGESDGQNA